MGNSYTATFGNGWMPDGDRARRRIRTRPVGEVMRPGNACCTKAIRYESMGIVGLLHGLDQRGGGGGRICRG